MRLGLRDLTGGRVDLAEKTMCAQAHQRLIRVVGQSSRALVRCERACSISPAARWNCPQASCPSAWPSTLPLQASHRSCAVNQSSGSRQVASIEAETGREALQEQSFLVDDVARRGRGPLREEWANLGPRDIAADPGAGPARRG